MLEGFRDNISTPFALHAVLGERLQLHLVRDCVGVRLRCGPTSIFLALLSSFVRREEEPLFDIERGPKGPSPRDPNPQEEARWRRWAVGSTGWAPRRRGRCPW